MYRIGRLSHHTHFRWGITLVLTCSIVLIGGLGVWHLLSHNNQGYVLTNNDQNKTNKVASSGLDTNTIDEPLFKLQLPKDWVLYKKDAPNIVYYFKPTAKYADDRYLSLYIDNDAASLVPVNRIIPVVSAGNKMSVGQMSYDCAQFAGSVASSSDPKLSKDSLARWQNITFLCDRGHADRNIVGISSSEGTNMVSLTSSDGIKHRYFLVYTDHSDQPDYTIFNDMLANFEVK